MVDLLYKYGCVNDYSRRLFSPNSLYFAQPSMFNDPFECDPVITVKDLKEDKYERWVKKNLKKDGFSRSEIRARAQTLIKSDAHKKSDVWITVRNYMKNFYDSFGMYCLSELCDEILMWSHYADKHRGYCIGFEAADHTSFFGRAQRVVYSSLYPEKEFLEEDLVKILEGCLLTKYIGWSYEKEWRLIEIPNSNEPTWGIKRYPACLMKKVILGARMPKDDKCRIKEWLSCRDSPVSLVQAKLHDSRYAVEFEDAE